MLTDVAIKKAKPKEKNYKLSDSSGLFLLVTKTGSKLWRFKYRFSGKEKLLAFGAYPTISLSKAREAREEAKQEIAKGIDPSLLKKKKKIDQINFSQNTLEAIAQQWFETKKTLWKEKHAASVWRSLERCVFHHLGKVNINDIDTPLVLSIIQKIEKNGATDTAHRIRQRVESIFNYAISIGIVTHNPAIVIKGALKPTIKNKHPAITDIEKLKEVFVQTDHTPAHPVTKLALRMLALTVVRSSELRGMLWQEVENGIWTIPAERMKRTEGQKILKEPHIVPLSKQALETLEVVKQFTGNSKLVFPSVNSRTEIIKPMSENAMGYLLNRAGYHGRHVPHGFRASFSTIMNERFPNERYIFDLMLAHKNENKVEAAYNRAEHLERRKVFFQLWADLLFEGLLPPEDLLSLERR